MSGVCVSWRWQRVSTGQAPLIRWELVCPYTLSSGQRSRQMTPHLLFVILTQPQLAMQPESGDPLIQAQAVSQLSCESSGQWKVDTMTDIHLEWNVIIRPIRGRHDGDQSEALIGSISTNWMRELSDCEPVTSTCLLFALHWYLAMRNKKCPSSNPRARRLETDFSTFHFSADCQHSTYPGPQTTHSWTQGSRVSRTLEHIEEQVLWPIWNC